MHIGGANMLGFAVGFMVGAIAGVLLIALASANQDDDMNNRHK